MLLLTLNILLIAILLASSMENKKELHVTLKGYLQSIGVVKENAVLTLGNEGQFDINMDQDFFGEAPAKVIVQEKNSFKSYLDIKPIVCFYSVKL